MSVALRLVQILAPTLDGFEDYGRLSRVLWAKCA